MYKGIGASTGIAIGKAFVLPPWEWDFAEDHTSIFDIVAEFEKLYRGILTSKDELMFIKKEVSELVGDQESHIFDAHMAILEDPDFMNEVQGMIRRQYMVAEVAVKEAVDKFAAMFDLLDNDLMKERASDIKDVGNRLLKHIMGAPEVTLPLEPQPFIVVTRDISPSQLSHFKPSHVQGIVLLAGGRNSHAAILARAMDIPLVLGFEGKITSPIITNDILVMDGNEGVVYVNPDLAVIEEYRIRQAKSRYIEEKLQEEIDEPAVTLEGKPMQLHANISGYNELEQALKKGATGVGLLRTEFIYMNRDDLPSEQTQFEIYRQLAEKLKDRPLTIRTLDIGGDKQIEYIPSPKQSNPSLGSRGVRQSFHQLDVFKTQLKAILRASPFGRVKIMVPMISTLEEVRKVKEILHQVKLELTSEHRDYNPDIMVGIMVEIPAAALMADRLGNEVDFISIGTNDLIQYTLAVDRMNEQVSEWYDPYHPAVIRLIKMTIDAAKRQHIPVSICGELAGEIDALPMWLGLGVSELSMTAKSIPHIKNQLKRISEMESRKMIDRVLECKTSKDIKDVLGGY